MPHFATRATLLSTEILKSKGMYDEAAAQLIKMTSEVNELIFYLSTFCTLTPMMLILRKRGHGKPFYSSISQVIPG